MKGLAAALVSVMLASCTTHPVRGIADKRTDFRRFLPMSGDPARYGLKAVRPFFQHASRAQLLRAIESACAAGDKRGSSVFHPETQAGYYVNCNPKNRQLLNGYVSRSPSEAPHGR